MVSWLWNGDIALQEESPLRGMRYTHQARDIEAETVFVGDEDQLQGRSQQIGWLFPLTYDTANSPLEQRTV